MKGSSRAKRVDIDNRRNINEYIRRHCKKCANKDTQLCHIVIKINGVAGCAEYEEKK